MILADTSVWINFFKGKSDPTVLKLIEFIKLGQVITGDLILVEILRGTQNDKEFKWVNTLFDEFPCYQICSKKIAIKAAENHRILKKKGKTTRKTIDDLIATFCIEMNVALLYEDRDFSPFELHLGLVNAISISNAP